MNENDFTETQLNNRNYNLMTQMGLSAMKIFSIKTHKGLSLLPSFFSSFPFPSIASSSACGFLSDISNISWMLNLEKMFKTDYWFKSPANELKATRDRGGKLI